MYFQVDTYCLNYKNTYRKSLNPFMFWSSQIDTVLQNQLQILNPVTLTSFGKTIEICFTTIAVHDKNHMHMVKQKRHPNQVHTILNPVSSYFNFQESLTLNNLIILSDS